MKEVIKQLVILYLSSPVILSILIIGILSIIFYRKIVGIVGELWVRIELTKLSKKDYLVLNNVMLKQNEITHQIDHIVISKFGIFVIETKNYKGLITGNEYQDKWIQHLAKKKYFFHNPIHQNYGHIETLRKVLNLQQNQFISIICFLNKTNIQIKSKIPVIHIDNLKNVILSYNTQLIENDIYEIKNKLKKQNIIDKTERKNHVEKIKTTIKQNKVKEKNNVCPKCGGKLVERKSRYGKFFGCSNYPICKYTKK